MKLPCELIRDLLPLYHDGVCSDVSRQTVEAHLQECESCRKLLRELDTELQAGKPEVDAAKPLEALGKAWKKNTQKALLKGVGATVLVFAVLFGCLLALTQWKWMTITTNYMEVAEIYQLADGRILYRLEVPSGVWSREFEFVHCGDGSEYLIPKRSVIELGEQEGWGSFLDSYLMMDVAETNAWHQAQGDGIVITKYYIGSPEESDPLLIWEEGMELEPAPAELEAIYGAGQSLD